MQITQRGLFTTQQFWTVNWMQQLSGTFRTGSIENGVNVLSGWPEGRDERGGQQGGLRKD